MAKADQTSKKFLFGAENCLNVEYMRSLVKQYSELGQWSSALFWADVAASAARGSVEVSGDDVWLLASTMLARGELHRAAHAVTSRDLHKRHLLCLGVGMRAYLAAREPVSALALLDECDPALLTARTADITHNRALAGVLVWQARALSALERREAAAEALATALRADCACFEALDLLLEQHALTPRQERELIESLPFGLQLSASEAELLRSAYRDRLNRFTPDNPPTPPDDKDNQVTEQIEVVRSRTLEAVTCRARSLAAACEWAAAVKTLDTADPWVCPEVRAACLVELRKSSELFAFAHTLVDAYPNSWTAWFAVGCYYYLIGKNEFARRYLSKAKSVEPGAGCVWLAYGHSFAADNEHDQAMAAYFKASQLMPGSHLPPLYVAVECSLLNNVSMCERFLGRAARTALHSDETIGEEASEVEDCENVGGWGRVVRVVRSAHVAHEAGAAAFNAGDYGSARQLWLRALHAAGDDSELSPRWAATVDGLGHAYRKLGQPEEAVRWHKRALSLRPARAQTLAALGLCLALLGRETDAADALHAALAKDPDDVVSLALLDAILDRLDAALTEEEIPQFPFPPVEITVPPPAAADAPAASDVTNTSDMSMSFE